MFLLVGIEILPTSGIEINKFLMIVMTQAQNMKGNVTQCKTFHSVASPLFPA